MRDILLIFDYLFVWGSDWGNSNLKSWELVESILDKQILNKKLQYGQEIGRTMWFFKFKHNKVVSVYIYLSPPSYY